MDSFSSDDELREMLTRVSSRWMVVWWWKVLMLAKIYCCEFDVATDFVIHDDGLVMSL